MKAFWDMAARILITLMMEAVRNSETSLYSNENMQRYIPEGSHIHSHHHENLKSHNHKQIYK
jgi:hypothetical protein